MEKIILRPSPDDFKWTRLVMIVALLAVIVAAWGHKHGATMGLFVFVCLIAIIPLLFFLYGTNGFYLEISPQHVAFYHTYRFGADRLVWKEELRNNREIILQQARIHVGRNETREGIKALVYKRDFRTYSKYILVALTPENKKAVLDMIEKHDLPLVVTKE